MKTRILVALGVFTAALFLLVSFRRDDVESRERAMGYTGAKEALDFWTRARAYPDADIPPDKYYKAYQYETAKFKQSGSAKVQSSYIWQPLGPLNLNGRSLSVAVNPQNTNTIYLGSASGGLWRSRTMGMGNDWCQIHFGYPALGISAIVIDPADSNTVYAGTGEVYRLDASLGGHVVRTTRGSYSIGILKTTDGGSTWTKALDWTYNQQQGVEKMAMNPLNHNTIWAATTRGILCSRNAGASWDTSLAVIMGEDIVIQPTDTMKMLASCGNFLTPGYGVYQTTDGGANWNPVAGLPAYSGKTMLGMYASNPNIVYASVADSTSGVGHLYKSTDFGLSWSTLPTNVDWGVQGWYSHYIAVHPTNPNLLAHAAVGMVYSTNGGSNFASTNGTYSDHHGFAVDPGNPNVLYDANDDGIYRSSDFGATFTNIGHGLMTGQLWNGFSSSATDSLLAIGQSQDHIPGYIYQGLLDWGRSANDECGWTAIDQTNDNIMYCVNRNGGAVYKSTTRGAGWSWMASFSGTGAWNSPIIVSRSTPSVLYFGDTKVYKSTTSGSSWAATNGNLVLDNNPVLAMAASSTSPDTVYAGTAPYTTTGHIYRTTNGGTAWLNITGSLPNRYPMDMGVDPHDSRVVYVTFGGFGSGHVYKSTDAGITWANITGTLPDVPTTAVAIDPENSNVYVGNDLSVYLSTDGGSTWNTFGEGLPDAAIMADLSISPSNHSLRAVTHGNGVWERKLYDGTPPPAFDYMTFYLAYPTDNAHLLVTHPITGMRATFRNLTPTARPDSFNVKFRILDAATEVYSSTERIPPLTAGETRQVLFSGSYTPLLPGNYALQAITMASDENPSNDTLKGTLQVITAPPITTYTFTKIHQAYSAITGGTFGPYGDDAVQAVALPFTFSYDGFDYDSVQISTNGWVEFGKGARGSERGLSSNSQLGDYYNPNDYLGTTDRPTKALGLWWSDMSTVEGSPTGVISYLAQGSPPDRVFIVQYKNIHAFYDPSYTTLLNFQLRLYETTNVIEFSYGPVVSGTFAGGAATGVKDYLGGDYRYYDFALGRTGLSGEVRTNLSPLTNWPGQDSCYRISPPGRIAGVAVVKLQEASGYRNTNVPVKFIVRNMGNQRDTFNLHASDARGWALSPVDSSVGIALGGQDTITLHIQISASDTAGTVDTVYLRASSVFDTTAWGIAPARVTILSSGVTRIYSYGDRWNMVSVPLGMKQWLKDSLFPAAVSPAFTYHAGYEQKDTLANGIGYWLKFSGTQSVTLAGVLRTEDSIAVVPGWNMIGSLSEPVAVSRIISIPPGIVTSPFFGYSAAYSVVDTLKPGKAYWVKVSQAGVLVFSSSGALSVAARIRIIPSGEAPPAPPDDQTASERRGIPAEFALSQNYPNPFNPSTLITYQLPVESRVTLKIYDILGRDVATLVDGVQAAGYRSALWHATRSGGAQAASGIYLYAIKSVGVADPGRSFTLVRKMLYVK